ncbi:hypothetical protein RDABS01_003798 [Bienertia sinuspersici]
MTKALNSINSNLKGYKLEPLLLPSKQTVVNIDSLSEAILISILSLLPTKVASRLSVISKRWRHLWTGVTAVELKLEQLLYCIIKSCFKLVCNHKVEEIQVTSASFIVPRCIFQCETLVNLDLNRRKSFRPHSNANKIMSIAGNS